MMPGSLHIASLLRAPLMHRCTSLLGAMMLVLMLWTGGATHAAAAFDCIPVTAEAPGHFDGDQDQVPSDPDQGVPHHHGGCSGHSGVALAGAKQTALSLKGNALPFLWSQVGKPGHIPEAQLRPPMA